MEYIFATHNKHKYQEIQDILKGKTKIVTLTDLNFHDDIPETADTLEGNAKQKADFVFNKFGKNCFADDTGLEIEALNGEPGVYSARYAGEQCSFDDNMNKVLDKLKGIENRKAVFKTVICLIKEGNYHYFEGLINGEITTSKRGVDGFGYDPIFLPDGYNKTFAELSLDEKNQISHRALATKKLIEFLLG